MSENSDGLDEDDPLYEILKELGEVPVPLKPTENIRMELVNRVEVEIEEEKKSDDLKQATLEKSVLLFQRLGGLPAGKTYLDILIKAKLDAEKKGNQRNVDDVDDIIYKLGQLEEKGVLEGHGYSDFLKEIFVEIEDIAKRLEELEKEKDRLLKALEEIVEQRTFMENKIAAFDGYLSTLKKNSAESFKKKTKKFSYKDLLKKGVIAASSIDDGILKKLNFEISQTAVDMFEIKAKVKIPGLNIGGATDLGLENLLEAKENAERFYDIGNGLVLNVRETLFVINKYFFSA
jgi:Ras GTPase-activating-like protein IQGAP2/3